MARRILRLELVLGAGILGLAGFVGAMVVSSAPKRLRTIAGISREDSLHIAAQYMNRIAHRGPDYHAPEWLADVQIARLQSVDVIAMTAADTTPVNSDSVSAVLNRSNGSYLDAMLAEDGGTVYRWRTSETPIRVWVQPYSTARGFSPDFVSPARRGFTAWNDLMLGVHFEVVDDSTAADVHVTWSAGLARYSYTNGQRVGVTYRVTSQAGWIVLAHVVLSTARDIYTVQNAARHEAGHVLGLGHSPVMDDIMAAATEGRQYKITDADARTVTLLYQLPAGQLPK
jgi:predicted Zn-dependent protease